MITGRDFVIVSSIAWDFLWQGHHELATRLGRAGNRVLFIDGSGIRAPGLRDTGRVARYAWRWIHGVGRSALRLVAENVWVVTPLVLPPFGPRWRGDMNRRFLLPRIRRAAASLGFADPIVITYLPTDTALATIDMFATARGAVAYYCVADFSAFATDVDALRKSEESLLRRADVVFATVPKLARDCGRFNSNVRLVPHGASVEPFHATPAEDSRAAADLSGIARPVVGYVGGLHGAIDYTLLREAVRMRPDWSWLFVGPVQVAPEVLPRGKNVHYLGTRTHAELPGYVARFDCSLVPYRTDGAADVVVPTKLNEYLAAGKPVVATAIPAVVDFERVNGEIIVTPATAADFVAGIERSLTLPAGEDATKRRRAIASRYDWAIAIREISGAIEEALDRRKQAAAPRP